MNSKSHLSLLISGSSTVPRIAHVALTLFLASVVPDTGYSQPKIKTEPRDQFLGTGKTASLSVVPQGTPPFSYQWFCNGTPVPTATNSVARITNVQATSNGDYFVVVSDATGSVTSRVARLKVFFASAHGFERLQVNPGGEATLSLRGETSALFGPYWDLFPVEVSSDLANWTSLATLQRANASFLPLMLQDTNASQFTQRFYRTPTNVSVTAFPEPTGQYAVGTFSRVIVDPARTNAYRYNKKTNAFMFTCWYPAGPKPGAPADPAWDKKLAQDWSSLFASATADSSWTTILPQLKAHAILEAPVAPGTNRYPVILFSHGYTVHRKGNYREMEELASHGYVAVAVDHEDCFGIEFPDGRYFQGPWSGSNQNVPYLVPSRVRDLLCVLDELRRMDLSDPWLAGRLDLSAVGTLAMSFGGSATGNLCRSNEWAKCAAFLDCAFHFEVNVELNQTGVQKPFLALNNDYPADALGDYFWPESTHLFSLATSNAIIFQIRNTSHELFCDWGWYFPMTAIPWNTAPARRTTRLIDACLVSFFDKYLKGEDDHFLDQAPPKFPDEEQEAFNFMRK